MTQEQCKSRQTTEELRHNQLTIQCAYDGKGKLRKKVEKFCYNTTEYAYDYDNAGHLVRVEQNGEVTEEYHFNAKGQRMAQRRESRNGMPLDTEQLRYDQRGRLETAGQTMFDYDERDALSGHYAQHGVTAFSYGQDTMLDMAVLPGGTKIRYEYDGFHPIRRYRYLTLTGEYVWDGLKLTVYRDHDLQLEYSFEYAPSGVLHKVLLNALSAKYRQTFSRDTNWPAESADWLHSLRAQSQRKRLWAYLETWYQLAPGIPSKTPLSLYVSCDQVGTPRMLTDRFGRVVKRLRQDSFGVLLEDSYPDLFLPVGFAGGLVDEDTGLVRFGWRDYDPKVGRFTAPDPANDRRGDGDVYDYCVDDPVSRKDTTGLAWWFAGAAAKALGLGLGLGGAYSAATGADKVKEAQTGQASTAARDAVKKAAAPTAVTAGIGSAGGALAALTPELLTEIMLNPAGAATLLDMWLAKRGPSLPPPSTPAGWAVFITENKDMFPEEIKKILGISQGSKGIPSGSSSNCSPQTQPRDEQGRFSSCTHSK